MTKLDAMLPQGAPATPARHLRDMSSQRDSWLRQMELVQLNAMNDANTAPVTPAREASAPGAAARPGDHGKAFRPSDHGAHARAATTAASPASLPATLAIPAASRSWTVPATGQPTSGVTMAGDDASAEAPAAAGPDSALHHRAVVLAYGSGAASVAAAPRSGLPDSAAIAAELAGEYARDWPTRVMHLTGENLELDLWIRDSALSDEAAFRLVALVARDSAAQGLRLRNVTLNGRAFATAGLQALHADTNNYFDITQPKDHHGTR